MKKPTIVMQSDFGIDSGLVACMHGMCRLVDSELETQDITHLIPVFDLILKQLLIVCNIQFRFGQMVRFLYR